MQKKDLKMSFDTNTIDHLGIKLYSTLPPVIAELISNAYDADAKSVDIFLYDKDKNNKTIVVKDTGNGMTFQELNDQFLVIGRNRRREGAGVSLSGRKVIGKKGLGKLSVFGIAGEVELITVKNEKKNDITLIYEKIKTTQRGKDYEPDINIYNEYTTEETGTTIILRNINRKSQFDPYSLAANLSKTFTLFDENFKCTIYYNDQDEIIDLNPKFRFKQFNYDFLLKYPNDFEQKEIFDELREESHYREIFETIEGELYVSDVPLKSSNNGFQLFSRGKSVQSNTFFNYRANDNIHAYMYGYFNVDFIDDLSEDLIATDRKSLNWTNDISIDLEEVLKIILRKATTKFRKLKENKKYDRFIEVTGFNPQKYENTLQANQRPVANKIFQSIITSEGLDDNSSVELIKNVVDVFGKKTFEDFSVKLDTIQTIEKDQAIKLLNDWYDIETKELAKLSSGRVSTVNQFNRLINQKNMDVELIKEFINKFPWLLFPRSVNYDINYRIKSEILNFIKSKNYYDASTIEFLAIDYEDIVYILELKQVGMKIESENIINAANIKEYIQKTFNRNTKYIIITDDYSVDFKAEALLRNLSNNSMIQVKTYKEQSDIALDYIKKFY